MQNFHIDQKHPIKKQTNQNNLEKKRPIREQRATKLLPLETDALLLTARTAYRGKIKPRSQAK